MLGKVGVAVSPARPERVWALIEAEDGALFRSEDGGETWERVCGQSSLRTQPWYYIHIYADPQGADTCWVLNYRVWKSTDAGNTFSEFPNPHGDNHDLGPLVSHKLRRYAMRRSRWSQSCRRCSMR